MTNNKTAAVVSISPIKAACKDCTLRELCLPLGLNEADIGCLDRIIRRRRTLQRGEQLYRMGEETHVLYAIRAGAFKTSELLRDGRNQVTGFYLAGELLGVDAISSGRHPCNAEALEESEVCEIPCADLEELARRIPGLHHQLIRLMSSEIAREESMLIVIGKMTAEERLASYLLNLSRRQERLGCSATRLKLVMSRQDIGDYLGLALETVSRLFSRFQEEGLITVHGKQIELGDLAGLRRRIGQDVDTSPAVHHAPHGNSSS